MKDLECGDIKVVNSGSLGIDFYSTIDGKKIMFLNQASELALLEWLKAKYPNCHSADDVLVGLKRGNYETPI